MNELTDEDVVRVLSAYVEFAPACEPERILTVASLLTYDLIHYFDSRATIGNDKAAKILASLALTATHKFQERFLENPSRFGPQFHAHKTVPVLLGKRKRDRDKAERVVVLSKAGLLRPTNTSGKQISSLVSRVAERLYDRVVGSRFSLRAISATAGEKLTPKQRKELEDKGAYLPEITRENAVKLYWPCCHRVLIELYGKQFENDPVFKAYWDKGKIKDLAGKAQRTEVRKRIRKDLKQGLVSLAPAS